MTELTPRDDIKKSVSEILRRVDQMIRAGSYEHALKETGRAKEMDPKNVYIQAYEERIATLIAEQQLKKTTRTEAKNEEAAELLADKTDKERRRFEEEERRAEDNLRKAAELKRRTDEELRKRRSSPPGLDPRPEVEAPVTRAAPAPPVEPQATPPRTERRSMENFLARLKDEELRRRKTEGDARDQAEEASAGETEGTSNSKYRRAVMNALTDGQLSAKEREIIQKLKAELLISDDQATKLESEARRDLYIRSFKDAWMTGKITPENTSVLGDIQRRFSITDDDHAALEAKILAAIASTERKPRIMVVDDDEKLLLVLADSLAEAGFEPIPLSTSDEAFRQARENPPDMIVSDINLETSTMGGFTFYEKVREIEELSDIPFIFLSGLTDEVLIRTGKELGVDDYITKPFSEEVLIATIKGKLRRFGQLKRKKR